MTYCSNITFVLFTFNEAARVERAVRNFIGSGRVLVVDNHSSDDTREIATRLGAEVLLHKNLGWVEDEHTVSVVKNAVETPWIYWAFADEMISSATMSAVLEAVESEKYSIVSLVRKNYYYGEFCHDAYRSTQNRAFKKEAIDFRGNAIHNFGKPMVPESEIVHLDPAKYFVHHFISNTAKVYMGSLDKYTDIEALHTTAIAPLRMMYRIARGFLGNYFVLGARRAGRAGIYLCMQTSLYTLLLSMKAYEREHDLTTSSIEARNNVVREALLHELDQGQRKPR